MITTLIVTVKRVNEEQCKSVFVSVRVSIVSEVVIDCVTVESVSVSE